MKITQFDKWEAKKHEVMKLTDKLGMPLDDTIVDTVVALQLVGINTNMSCGGHVDRNTAGPYIMFADPVADKMEFTYRTTLTPKDDEYKRQRIVARDLNLHERQKLLLHLDAFYSDRRVPYTTRLIVSSVGGAEMSRLQCQGAELVHILSAEESKQILRHFQDEFRAFTDYLRSTI
jgi:hypothetical protein